MINKTNEIERHIIKKITSDEELLNSVNQNKKDSKIEELIDKYAFTFKYLGYTKESAHEKQSINEQNVLKALKYFDS
jgi:hypothetical protein